jgi:hypothetical protein
MTTKAVEAILAAIKAAKAVGSSMKAAEVSICDGCALEGGQ